MHAHAAVSVNTIDCVTLIERIITTTATMHEPSKFMAIRLHVI